MSSIDKQKQLDELLNQFEEQRQEIKSMIVDLEKLRSRIDLLIPEQLDSRYVRFFEEKVKTLTSFFSILLEMRKEITKNLKEEIELRRKLDTGDEFGSIEEYLNIRDFASKVDEFKRHKEKMQKKREKDTEKDMKNLDNLVTIRESG